MFRKILVYFLLQTLLYYNGISVANPLIGKSKPAKRGDFPFIVSLSHVSNIIDIKNHFCGGTLISKRHVLTSDHCVERNYKNDVQVIVGTINFNDGQIYRIESYTPYELWAYKNDKIDDEYHDIGILTLSQDVKNAQLAVVSSKSADQIFGKKVVTAGWGLIDEINRTRPNTLLKSSNLKVLSPKEYEKYTKLKYGESKTPQPQYYYSMADPPVILGEGDSGGPLILESTKELIGINDGSCIATELPLPRYSSSCHLRLNYAHYQQFIKDTIRNYL